MQEYMVWLNHHTQTPQNSSKQSIKMYPFEDRCYHTNTLHKELGILKTSDIHILAMCGPLSVNMSLIIFPLLLVTLSTSGFPTDARQETEVMQYFLVSGHHTKHELHEM